MKVAGLVIFLLLLLVSASPSFAHPGNTAADGCHYCRTNCDKWGEAWNARHCHGGGSTYTPPVYEYNYPTNTPVPAKRILPTAIPTRIPTSTPTSTPTPTATPTVTLTVKPTDKPTNTPTPQVVEVEEEEENFWIKLWRFLFG